MTDSITIKELGCLNKNLKTLDERKKYLTNEKYNVRSNHFIIAIPNQEAS